MRILASSVIALAFMLTIAAAPSHAQERNVYIDRLIFSLYGAAAYKARVGDWAGAALDYERAYRLQQNSSEIMARYAEALLRIGKYPEAEKFARRAIEEDSTASDAYVTLAELALNRNDAADADKFLARRLALKPDDLESRMRLGLIRETVGDLEGVVDAFRGYPALKPGAAMANFHMGVALVRLKKYDEAKQAFRDALRENPSYIEAAENIAIICEELEEDSEAIEAWNRVLKIDPDRTDAYKKLIALYVSADRYPEATAALESLLERVPDKNGALRKLLAQMALTQGDLSLASRSMFELARRAGTETGYIEAALVAAKAGTETDVLIASLESAWRINRRPKIAITLIQALAAVGRESEATEMLSSLDAREIHDTGSLFTLGLLWTKFDDETRAIELFMNLIEKDPYNAQALNFVGYTWAERGINLDRAEELIRRALAVDPENPQYIDSLGWIFYKKGLYDIARIHLEKAYHLMQDEPEIMEHLGDAYYKLKKLPEAARFYKKALDSGHATNPDDLKRKLSEVEKFL